MADKKPIQLPLILKKIANLTEADAFGEGNLGRPVLPGERVLPAVMTPFHKACCVLFQDYLEQIVKSIMGRPISQVRKDSNTKLLFDEAYYVGHLMTDNFRELLGADFREDVALRDGWRLVTKDSAECVCQFCQLQKLLVYLTEADIEMNGIRIIVMDSDGQSNEEDDLFNQLLRSGKTIMN